jgi:putative transposase
LADRVPITIVYLLVRRVLSLAVLLSRRDLDKDAELLALRHENAVLRRHAERIRYEPADRIWFAALAQLIPRVRWAQVFPVTPATLLAWHRKLAARKYDTSGGRRPGRPPAIRSIARLAVRMVFGLVGGSDSSGRWPGAGVAIGTSAAVPLVRPVAGTGR